MYDPPIMVADPSPTDARLVLVTAPPDAATNLARTLVEERLAACVNLVPGLRSVYRWKDAVQDDPETLLVLKTAADRIPALMARIPEIHPYDVPEILAFTPDEGHPAYLQWLLGAVTEAPAGQG